MSSWVEAMLQQNDRTPEVDLLSSPDEPVRGLLDGGLSLQQTDSIYH